MKKAMNLLAVVMMLSIVLSGCQSAASGTTAPSSIPSAVPSATAVSQTSSATQPPQPETVKLAPYELQWYFVGPSQQRDNEKVEKEIDKYLADKINATIKLNLLDWGTYEPKMKAMIAAGEPFDMLFTCNWFVNYITYSQQGAFVALDDYFKTELAGTKAILGDDFVNASKISGHNYAIPCNKEKARDWGFVYNKTLADKYGIDMSNIKSFGDIEPALKTIQEKEPDVIPLFNDKNQNLGFIPWNAADPDEVGVVLPDGKVVNQYETPEYKAAYDQIRDFYNKGYLRKDVATMKDGPAIRQSGKFFCFPVNLKPGYADEQNTQARQNGFELGQVDVTPAMMTNQETMGSMQAISKTSKDPQRAAMFLELFNTDKYLNNLVNFGIENVHYVKVDENTIKFVNDSGYYPNMAWMFGNQLLNFLGTNEDPQKWAKFDTFNKSATPSADLGFIFDKTPVLTEEAATANVIKTYNEVMKLGAIDPVEKLPEFIAKLKEAGADKIVQEMQKQYDSWKASK